MLFFTGRGGLATCKRFRDMYNIFHIQKPEEKIDYNSWRGSEEGGKGGKGREKSGRERASERVTM